MAAKWDKSPANRKMFMIFQRILKVDFQEIPDQIWNDVLRGSVHDRGADVPDVVDEDQVRKSSEIQTQLTALPTPLKKSKTHSSY